MIGIKKIQTICYVDRKAMVKEPGNLLDVLDIKEYMNAKETN